MITATFVSKATNEDLKGFYRKENNGQKGKNSVPQKLKNREKQTKKLKTGEYLG